jgi:site-specific recombinase
MAAASIDWAGTLSEAHRLADDGQRVAALRRIVKALRPEQISEAPERVAGLCDHLEHGAPEGGPMLGRLLRDTLAEADCVLALTDAGIPSDRNFFDEIAMRLGRRLLPEVDRPEDLRGMIRAVFHDEADFRWLAAVPTTSWKRLLSLMGITAESVGGVADELESSIQVLGHHAASLGLHPYLTERLTELDDLDSPFLALSHRVLQYLESFANDVEGDEEPLLDRALATVADCRAAVFELRRNKHRFGTSLRLTRLSHRLLKKLDRLEVLLHLSEPVERDFQLSAIRIFRSLVEAENTRDHLGRHARSSADILLRQFVMRPWSYFVPPLRAAAPVGTAE